MMRQTVFGFKLERTDETLTAHGGLARLAEYHHGLGLRALADEHLPGPGSNRGPPPGGLYGIPNLCSRVRSASAGHRPELEVFVSKLDDDGLDIAGIRPVDIRTPQGTNTCWNVRTGFRAPDLCGLGGFHPLRHHQGGAPGDR